MKMLFKQLGGLLIGGPAAGGVIGLIRLAIIAALICGAGFAAWHFLSTYTDSKARGVTIEAQKVDLKRKDSVIADQTKQAENRDQGKKAEDGIILKLDTTMKKTDRKTEAVIAEVVKKVEEIQAAPDKTAEEKDKEIATTQITSLWQNFCDSGGESAACHAAAASS